MPKMTAMTMPAIAPGLSPPPPLLDIMGSVLPLAVAGERKGTVVVAFLVEVVVESPPLVGRTGAAPDETEVTVGAGWSVNDQRDVAVATLVQDPNCMHL